MIKASCIGIFLWLLLFSGTNSVAYTTLPTNEIMPIKIALYVNDITAVEEKIEAIEVELTLFQQWNDKRLAFDPGATGSKTKYYYDDDALRKLFSIWQPNLILKHLRGEPEVHKIFLTIDFNGTVTLLERFNAQVETVIDVKQFPFDSQELNIPITPFSKNYKQLEFIIDKDKEGIAEHAHLAEWSILGYSGKVTTFNSILLGKNVPEYVFTIKYKREWMFYLFKLLFPLFMIIILSWSVFWLINQPSVNSVTVAFMALLTIVAFQWVVTNSIPRVAYPTFFESLVLFSYITVALTIAGLVWINNVSKSFAFKLQMIFRWLFPLYYVIGVLALALGFFA